MKKIVLSYLLGISLISFYSCDNSTGGTPSIATETINFQDDNGWIQYKTNDSTKYEHGNWYYYNASEETEMTELIVNCNKISGASHSGYGIIFCHEDNSNFNRLLITKNGSYQILDKTNGTNTLITDWTYSEYLNTGYDVINQLKITYNSSTDNFNFYCNNNLVTTIARATFPGNRLSGKSGFYASIGSETDENFPEVPVNIKYQMLAPVSIP